MLAGRRSGFTIILFGSLCSTIVLIIHIKGRGIATYHDAFFVWTLLALGTAAIFSMVLAVQGLCSSRRSVAARGVIS